MRKGLQKESLLLKELYDILKDKPDAISFLCAYVIYCHAVDDLVDEPSNVLNIEKVTDLADDLFSCDYWRRNSPQLWLIEKMAHMLYFNSVTWEQCDIPWKQRDAKVLSHIGYLMFFAVLMLETNSQTICQAYSLKLMEVCHLNQYQDMSMEVKNA